MAWVIVVVAVYGLARSGTGHERPTAVAIGIGMLVVLALLGLPARVQRTLLKPLLKVVGYPRVGSGPADPLEALRTAACRAGGGVHLGGAGKQLRFSRSERAVLLLGPPRSGRRAL